MQIRKAKLEDLKTLQDLNAKLFEKEHKEYDETLDSKWPYSKEGKKYFTERIQKGCTLLAILNNKIVGYMAGGLSKPEVFRKISPFAELETMFVLKEARNLGIGSKFIEEFFSWCKKKKIKRVKITATAQNEKAINLYRKYGFKDYVLILEKDI